MKKKVIIVIVIIVCLIFLVPIPMHLNDGGTVEYKAIAYKISKVHRINMNSETGYDDGIIVEILGLKVYDNIIAKQKEDVNVKNDINNNTENSTFIRTYNILNIADSNDENYIYLTIRQFQEEEVKTVKVEKRLANSIEIGNDYEFTFKYTDNAIQDNIESIFTNAVLVRVEKTDKQGLEQVQDLIR